MNYMYTPGVLAGTQVPYQPTFVPQGVIGSQFGQLAGNLFGQFLPGPFGGIASQLLPQVGNLLPFQAGPQSPFLPQGVIGSPMGHLAGGIAGQIPQVPYGGIPYQQGPFGVNPYQGIPQAGTVIPFHGGQQWPFLPQGVIGSPMGHLAGGIAGQIPQVPYGGIPNPWMQQGGGVPFQGGPQSVLVPQGIIGGQLGQWAGNFLGHFLPGPFGGIPSQLLPQLGSVLLPFQAGPQQPLLMGGYGNQPFVHVGVQW
jgi:hypothetical protein